MILTDCFDRWLWLKLCVKLNSKKGYMLFEKMKSIDAIYEGCREDYEGFDFLKREDIDALCDKNADDIPSYSHALKTNNIKLLTPDMEEYPRLLSEAVPPPYLLFVRGNLINLNRYPCVSVVGTRKPTEYGERMTKSLVHSISSCPAVIVSGLALGVDAIAHKAALECSLPTVAVLGCGVNIVYPKTNRALADSIAQAGMILSEYPLSVGPEKYHFPERNRIIAALSHVTAVTEADIKSGSLITADIAFKLGRDVYAMPGNIDSLASRGTNHLLGKGAHVLTSADEIISSFFASCGELIKNAKSDFSNSVNVNGIKESPLTHDIPKENKNTNQINTPKEKDNTLKSLYDIPSGLDSDGKILFALSKHALTIDELCAVTGVSIYELDVKLLMMEIGGKIRKTRGNYYTLV